MVKNFTPLNTLEKELMGKFWCCFALQAELLWPWYHSGQSTEVSDLHFLCVLVVQVWEATRSAEPPGKKGLVDRPSEDPHHPLPTRNGLGWRSPFTQTWRVSSLDPQPSDPSYRFGTASLHHCMNQFLRHISSLSLSLSQFQRFQVWDQHVEGVVAS